MATLRRTIGPFVALAAFAASTGCDVDPYHIAVEVDARPPQPDAAPVPDATPVPDTGPPDAAPDDGCVPEEEMCDGVDQNCNGIPDDGFNTQEDPENCGSCGNECFRPNTSGDCNAGLCAYQCLSGFWDLDGDILANGCEYPCIPTNGGVEACDFDDNDCDGVIDEDFDTTSDEANCGGCGQPCVVLHATPECTAGVCGYTACDPGYADLLPSVAGCEYTCPVFPIAAESCNNIDDDCDGAIDDGNPGGGAACGATEGACAAGTTTCQFGSLVCTGGTGPGPETCDEVDNDCDGVVDDGFDKLNDPYHCGGCSPCNLPFAVEGCTAGACTVIACQSGHVDQDGVDANGCEYACTPSGPETCDGVDNDCDTLTDEGLTPPTGLCLTAGGCAGTTPVCGPSPCDAAVRWRCLYAAPAEADACGGLALNESICDDIDGDCDNAVDDSFPMKGTACDDGGIGLCRGTGSLACNAAGTGLACDVTSPGASPSAEVCNDLDDDCDGALDEGAPDDMVHVVAGGLDFWIYRYEASRPDATAAVPGVADHRACTRPGTQPWRNVSWTEAAAACGASGKRLCAEAEWELACAGALADSYPYGDAYSPEACNGNDYDADCTGGDQDLSLPTGTAYGCPAPAASMCVSDYGVYDLSGNLKEWTSTIVAGPSPSRRIRGGSYDNVASGLTCQFDFVSAEESYYFGNLGFRCCSDTP